MAPPRTLPMAPMVTAVIMTAAVLGTTAWRLNLQSLETRIDDRRSTLNRLLINKSIPPNDAVASYLTQRRDALDRAYQRWLNRVVVPQAAEAATADPQLYFQERFHAVQRTLERLATARTLPVPELLGFPKDLPPSETVPRLLVQLALIEEAGPLILEQGISVLASFKIEDPDTVAAAEGGGVFLTRVPVRVRFSGLLPQIVKVLGAVGRAKPLMDVRLVRIVAGSLPPPAAAGSTAPATAIPPPAAPAPVIATGGQGTTPVTDRLDVDLVLVRYLANANAQELPEDASGASARSPASSNDE